MDASKNYVNSIPEHSDYVFMRYKWDIIDDCLEGEDKIKLKGTCYLPKTMGMETDKQHGDEIYKAYKMRADYYDYPADFYMAIGGLLRQKDPELSFPDEMDTKFVPSPSYVSNKSFYDVYSDVIDYVTKYARHGILLDIPEGRDKAIDLYPVIVQYNARQIKHWGTTIYKGQEVVSFVVLDESYYSYDNASLSQIQKPRYRFLGLKTLTDDGNNELDTPIYYTYSGETWDFGIFNPPYVPTGVDVGGKTVYFPSLKGKTMPYIPFWCIGTTKIGLDVEKPIIYPLCKASLALYRLSADYKEYLFKQGFALLFGHGFKPDTDIYVGGQKAIIIEDEHASLDYVEISGVGLSEYRLAMEAQHQYALQIGINIMKSSGDETGQSVLRRTTLKTASLKTIAKTIAQGMTAVAKAAAYWRGLPQKEIDSITILPNIDFSGAANDTSSFMNVYSIWSSDVKGLSDYSYYAYGKKEGFITENTYDEWLEIVKAERESKKKEQLALASAEQKFSKLSNSGQNNLPVNPINKISTDVDDLEDDKANRKQNVNFL